MLDQIIVELEQVAQQHKLDLNGNTSIEVATQIRNNKHNPITATYYLLIKKYERDTAQNLVFGKFTREKRMREQLRLQQSATQSAGNLDSRGTKIGSHPGSSGLMISKKQPISNSIPTMIQENYNDSLTSSVIG